MNSLKLSAHNRAYSFLEQQGRVFTPTCTIILLEPDHTVQCVPFVCSQAENPVSFCKPTRAVTDGITLQSSAWNVLLGRQKLFGRVSWCLYPPFLPPRQNGWVSHSLEQESESKRCEAKGCNICPIWGCGEKQYSLSYFFIFSNYPLSLKDA